MAIVAQGQISIVDLHDMPPVQAHLDANKSKILIKKRDGSVAPTISAADPLLISAELYESGSQTNLFSKASGVGTHGSITGITWQVRQGSAIIPSTDYSSKGISLVTPTNGYPQSQLKITNTTTLDPNITVSAIVDYKYTGMNEATPISIDIDFSTVYHGTDGDNAMTVSFSNTAHIFPVDSRGYLLPGTKTTIEIQAYEGTEKIKSFTVSKGTHSNLFTVDIKPITSDSKIIVDIGVNNAISYRLKATGAPDTEQGVIPFKITANGREVQETFSWAVTSKGVNGNDSTSYWMIPSTTRVISKPDATSGAYSFSPTSITLAAKQQKGTDPVSNMTSPTFKYMFYNDAGVPGAEQTGSTISNIPAGTTKIDVKLFNSSNTLLDFETIDVVKIEKDPVTVALSSDTREVRNQSGVANITFTIYRNGEDVSSSSKVTWSKNGTVDSNNTTNKITVSGASITNFVLVKAEVSIQGTKYYDTISIIDVSDPITLQLMSSKGDQFVNGNVDTTLKADVWRSGELIDTDGKTYKYTWKKLNPDGSQDKSFGTNGVKTGKSIPVTGSEVSRKAIFICELSN